MVGTCTINQAPLFPEFLEEAGTHAAPKDAVQDKHAVLVFMIPGNALRPQAQLHLFRVLPPDCQFFAKESGWNIQWLFFPREPRPMPFGNLYHLRKVNVACQGQAGIIRRVKPPPVVDEILPVQAANGLRRTENRVSQRVFCQ